MVWYSSSSVDNIGNILIRLTGLLRQRLKDSGWFDDVNDLALGE